jgi:DNA-directed RNA polymerase specialized sigma subunit
MESDLSLINKIKDNNHEPSLLELINRHSGIYASMVEKFTKSPSSVIDKRSIMDEKDYTIYSSALKFDPEKSTKFSTYLANETKWKCLNILNKIKKNKTYSMSDELNFIEPSCDSFLNDLQREEVFEGFKKILNEEKDERLKKIIDMRYYMSNNKLTPWKKIAKELNLSIQGCINIHNKFINNIKKEINHV